MRNINNTKKLKRHWSSVLKSVYWQQIQLSCKLIKTIQF